MKTINRIQKLQLELMREASFNSFDGDNVANDLEKHLDLWRAAIIDRPDLIKLRDLPDCYWNVDTLYILPEAGKENELESLAKEWQADEVDWIGGVEACHLLGSSSPEKRANTKSLLRVWWD